LLFLAGAEFLEDFCDEDANVYLLFRARLRTMRVLKAGNKPDNREDALC
jgi:hypothetical protein